MLPLDANPNSTEPKRSGIARMTALAAIVALIVSVVLSSIATPRVGLSEIDVGIDVISTGAVPSLSWPAAESASPRLSVEMQRVSKRFTLDQTIERWHARIPRRALSDLRIVLAGAESIERLYVGSLVPRVFFRSPDTGAKPWGRVVRGWSPRAVSGTISLAPISPWERGGAGTFIALGALVFFVLCILMALAGCSVLAIRSIWRAPEPERTLAPFNLHVFVAFFIPLLLVWMGYWLCFFPAAMTGDSIDQWRQAQSMHINDHHPAFHTLTIKAITLIWNSPGAVVLAQIVMLSASFSYALSLLLRAGVPPLPVALAFLATLLSPRNGTMAVVLWKDVFYSACILLLTVLLAHSFLDRDFTKKKFCWVAIGALLCASALYRHNGLLVLVGATVILPIGHRASRRRAWATSAAALLIFVLIKCAVYPWLSVAPRKSFAPFSLTVRLAALIDQDPPLSESEHLFLEQIRTFGDRWRYSPVDVNGTLWPSSPDRFDFRFALENLARYRRISVSLFTRYPLVFIRHYFSSTSYLYCPVQLGGLAMAGPAADISDNDQGLELAPILPAARETLIRLIVLSSQKEFSWLFWRPGLYLYAVLIACAILIRRTGDLRFAIVFCPVLLNTLSLFIAGNSQEHRFQYPLVAAAGFLICLAFLPARPPCPSGEKQEIGGAPQIPSRKSTSA